MFNRDQIRHFFFIAMTGVALCMSATLHGDNEKEKIENLIKQLEDSDAGVRLRAAYALGKLGEHAKGAVSQLAEALKDSDAEVRWGAIQALEYLRFHFPEEIDRLFREKLVSPRITNVCKILCGLVDRSSLWIDEHFETPGVGFNQHTFGFSLLSLSALFLSKASPFCKSVKPVIDTIIAHLSEGERAEIAEGCPAQAFPFEDLRNLATTVLKMTASPLDSPQVYGKQFFILFLRDVLKRGIKNNDQKQKIESLLKNMEDSLGKDLSVRHVEGTGGSLFNTYALSTALLTLHENNKDAMALLQDAIHPDNPLSIKYGRDEEFPSPRASSARAVPVHLARYVRANKEDREHIRPQLISAIQNYVKHLPSLIAHLRRGEGEPHMDPDRLAPYYLYATIPYQTAAIQMLIEENKPEEKEMLEKLKKEPKDAILSLVREDGQFYVPEYEPSPGYVNPLFGLALIPLAEDCAKEDLESYNLHGILK